MVEPPTPLALLVADRVYHDRHSGKWIVSGIFSTIGFPALPRQYDHMEIFFQVTNITQPTDLRLRIEHADGDLLMDMGGPIKAKSPLDVMARRVVVRQLPFKKTGKHWVMLQSSDAILTQVPLYVGIVKPPQQQPGGGEAPEPG